MVARRRYSPGVTEFFTAKNWSATDESQETGMIQTRLYPMRFEPIYQYRLWGGRRLADLLTVPLPGDGPFGEAWVLSDR
jgi:hypothetical protein